MTNEEPLRKSLDIQLEVDPIFTSIKQKIDDLVLPYEDDAWYKFEEASTSNPGPSVANPALPTAASVSASGHSPIPILKMEGPRMDAIIKEKLNSLHLLPYQNDWLDLLEKLEARFDQKIQNSLNKLEVPHQKNDWRLMSQLLDQIYAPVRTFPWLRASAAAVIFFLFLIGV